MSGTHAHGPGTERGGRAFLRTFCQGAVAVSTVFLLVTTVVLLLNAWRLRSADPVNSRALEALRQELRARPGDPALVESLRDLDLLVRRAQVSAVDLSRRGALLLLGGAVVLLAALRTLASMEAAPRFPGRAPPPPRPLDSPRWERRLVAGFSGAAAALGLALFALSPDGPPAGEPAGDGAPAPPWEERLGHWPSFRGPDGLARARGAFPTAWDGADGRGVLWKSPVPRPGFSSPVVWGDRVFLTGADAEAREVYCYDARDGRLLWRHVASGIEGSPAELPQVTADTGFAAASPAVDGARVYAVFATGDLVALDLEGRRLWGRNLGLPDNPYGHASSPLPHRGRVILQYDQRDRARLLAVDGASGRTVWERPRDVTVSWSSPILVSRGGREELVASGNPWVAGYDPGNGQERWRIEVMGGELASSPAWDGERVFAANEYATLAAIGLDGPPAVLWTHGEGLPEVSSPASDGKRLYVASGVGALTCLDCASGAVLWRQDFFEGFYGSPIVAEGLVYAVDRGGGTRVFESADAYREVSYPQLGQRSSCTPAMAGGRIYIRGQDHLFCLAEGAAR